ncbi:uncharacterized protein F54H12.2-like [Diadema antillarum]|uniref:uncharacterized protein F54H12.2-like n=1 Tax=Diadema antillarum TaxID=105358 RepID=UPI003A88D5D3
MEKLHKLSCDCSKSEIDLFSIPPTQTTIEQGKWVEFFPVTSIADATPIQFHLQSSPEEYTDLSQTLLHLKAKVVNADGTALTDESSVAPVNLFLHSLFSEVDVMFNDTLITPSTNTYPYRAMFENLLTYGRDAKLSQLTSSLFYKDTAGYMEINDPLASSNTNEGLNKRHEFTKLSKTVDMVGRLHVDASFQDRLIMGGVDIKFKLHRSKNAFSLMSSTPEASYKVKITEASLLPPTDLNGDVLVQWMLQGENWRPLDARTSWEGLAADPADEMEESRGQASLIRGKERLLRMQQ